MADVLVIGSAVVDFVFATEELPTAPTKYRAEHAEIVGGGCAANAAVAVSRLGGRAYLGARLGDDQLGSLIIGDLEAEGVRTDLVQITPGGASSFSSIYVDASGERQIMNFRGSGLTDATAWIAGVPQIGAVLADTRWPAAAIAGLELASVRNVPGVLDAEAPIDTQLLEHASHVAFSRQGLLSVSTETDLEAALRDVSARYPAWMCVTDGENGTFFLDQGSICTVPAFKVQVKDTLGAGDVWHGAFTLALAEGQDERASVRFANAAAALKCTTFGGRKGCPNRQAVDNLLKENT